jgi:hypothetical protein
MEVIPEARFNEGLARLKRDAHKYPPLRLSMFAWQLTPDQADAIVDFTFQEVIDARRKLDEAGEGDIDAALYRLRYARLSYAHAVIFTHEIAHVMEDVQEQRWAEASEVTA